MFGGISVGSGSGLDDVLKILEVVSDPAKAKAAVAELKKQTQAHQDKHQDAQKSVALAEKRAAEASEKLSQAEEKQKFLERREAGLAERSRTVEGEFAKLAAEQTAFAKDRQTFTVHAHELKQQLDAREASVAAQEKAVAEAQARVKGLEGDLRRRLDLIKSAAA